MKQLQPKSIKQQLDDLFNEWVKRDTAEVRARVDKDTDSIAVLSRQLELQEWAGEPHEQMAQLLDFHPQFKKEYAEKARQHLVSIGDIAH